MATQQTATVYVRNEMGGNAHIQLFHQNDSNGTQNGSWFVAPGAVSGPLTVHFETGWGSYGILDWWGVVAAVKDGPAPGVYQNTGTLTFPDWKECQLQSADANRQITLTVSPSSFEIPLPSGGCSDGMRRITDRFSKISNVFVLMLENHSFDNILGQSGIPGIQHATTSNSNEYDGTSYHVSKPAPTRMPTDPGHEFTDVVQQLCGEGVTFQAGHPYPAIDNSGFAADYATTSSEGPTPPAADVGQIMAGFDTQHQLPVTYALATQFAICDHWYSSLPGPTWPNRFFLHGASSAGLDHSPSTPEIMKWELPDGFKYPNGSIFEALENAGLSWKVYNDNTDAYSDDPSSPADLGAVPQVTALKGMYLTSVNSLTHFASDLQAPYTTQYTFIEPNYGDITGNTYVGGSSQHPMDDVYGGEGLIKAVYEAIRNSPLWNTSLLIVTYDEHGGFYDSVAPPPANPPADGSDDSDLNEFGFAFDQYGVRVPAIVASPWIPAGTVNHNAYDHASVLRTIELLFGMRALTQRDAKATDVLRLLTATSPRTDAPTTLPSPAPPSASRPVRTPETIMKEDDEPLDLRGNLPGFLGAAMSTEALLTTTTEAEREALKAEYAAIRTRGDARRRIARVVAMADAVKRRGAAGSARQPRAGT